ncbi:helix-turn-helix transcriptional regulator [Microvirga sp. SM9]|nr:helix-turn-helix transcriptional regulator [Microvirga lenta]
MKSIHTTRQERLCMLLRHARKKAGLTQEELNQRLGKYKTFVSKYESGERRLDIMEFIDIAEALDLDPASVLKAVMSGET